MEPPGGPWRPWAPFVIPYALFLALTSFEPSASGAYPVVYGAKVAIVALGAWIVRPSGAQAAGLNGRMRIGSVLAAVLLGGVLTAVWVGLDPFTPHFRLLGARVGYNPYREIHDPVHRAVFLIVRFVGLVVLIPWIEELFFRGFLLRYLADPVDWALKRPEEFGAGAAAVNVLLFATIHPEWLVAAVFALGMVGLLRATKDVRACVLAHAVCNLLLGIYVVRTGSWAYW